MASTITMTPAAEDGLRSWVGVGGSPFVLDWGYGDVFYQSDAVDMTIIDFNLSAIPHGNQIGSATLTFFMQTQHESLSPSPLDMYWFYGESSVNAEDWDRGNYFKSFDDVYGLNKWDLTPLLQSAVDNGAQYLDLRISSTDSTTVSIIDPPWRSPRTSMVLVVPEPGTCAILTIGTGLVFVVGRRKEKSRPQNLDQTN